MMVSFCAVLFPRGVLDEILNLIESLSESFPSYSCWCICQPKRHDVEVIQSAIRCYKGCFLFYKFSETLICRYPLAKSKVLNHNDPAKDAKVSSILGRGYASF